MRLGFSGSRHGLTEAQARELESQFQRYTQGYGSTIELHVGDCVGADVAAAVLGKRFGWTVVNHPPLLATYRAFFNAYDKELAPKYYLDRNKDIVDACQIFIAAPDSEREVQRSGTWSTVRYARKMDRPILIVFPSGKSKGEEGEITEELI